MATNSFTSTGSLLLVLTIVGGLTGDAQAADVAAGEAKVQQLCADCHRRGDWSGETTSALRALIADIVAGKITHSRSKIELTPQEIADIAAYWTAGRK